MKRLPLYAFVVFGIFLAAKGGGITGDGTFGWQVSFAIALSVFFAGCFILAPKLKGLIKKIETLLQPSAKGKSEARH